ncbi:MAG: hypothetical protein Kow00108_19120 [Calditrichia bacterium]
MGIFDQIILPPSIAVLSVLKGLIAFTFILHLAFVAIVLGSLFLSLYYYKKNPLVSEKLAHLIGETPASLIVFGFLPFVTLIFLFGQYFYGSPLKVSHYFEILFIPATIGFGALYYYKKNRSILPAVVSLISILFSYFFFLRIFDLMTHTEVWQFADSLLPHAFSIQTIIHFIQFILFSLFLTGVTVLFIYYSFEERKLDVSFPSFDFLKHRAWGWVIAPAVILPLFILWDAYVIQVWTINNVSLILSAVSIFMLLLVSFILIKKIKAQAGDGFTFLFVVGLTAFIMLGMKWQFDFLTSTQEYYKIMALGVNAERQQEVSEREVLYAKMMKPDPALGEQIYNNKCSSCHAFETKIFGPPYKEVLGKYAGNLEALNKFISNPVKVNPEYPPMPSQGLTTKEVLSIASYLLSEYEKYTPKENQ